MLADPRRLTEIWSWHEHIPFGFTLVDLQRPRVLVELGTHRGDSYCAFCQAVDTLGLATRCFAVDTWQGDKHAGFYDDSVFRDLCAYHDPLYGRFSTLLRSRFDEALGHFPERSVDLLHIDGLHTYDAVSHDFGSWLPKMSSRGVVLLHDISVRVGDFGVWRLWEEIRSAYPTVEFHHCCGLGVAAVGEEAEAALGELFAAGDGDGLQKLYACLGGRISLIRERFLLQRLAGQLNGRLAASEQARAAAEQRLREIGAADPGRRSEPRLAAAK